MIESTGSTAVNAADVRPMDFVANGENAVVEEVYSTEKLDDMISRMCASISPTMIHVSMHKISLDTLTTDTANLPPEKQRKLFDTAMASAGLGATASATAIRDALKANPYYNSLQVKYAYAVTCHKAQGGQWASVFVDMGYIPPEAYRTLDFYRWLYTATSRATSRLSLVNPSII